MRQILFRIRNHIGELTRRIHIPVKDLRQRGAALHTGIISHDHGIYTVIPLCHHDHIAAHEDNRRLLIHRACLLHQLNVFFVQPKA